MKACGEKKLHLMVKMSAKLVEQGPNSNKITSSIIATRTLAKIVRIKTFLGLWKLTKGLQQSGEHLFTKDARISENVISLHFDFPSSHLPSPPNLQEPGNQYPAITGKLGSMRVTGRGRTGLELLQSPLIRTFALCALPVAL